MTHISAHMV